MLKIEAAEFAIWLVLLDICCGQHCPRVCPPGQKTVGDQCAQFVQLRERCNQLNICEPAFSACLEGVCRCLYGFSEFGGHCMPLAITCPQSTYGTRVNYNLPCTVTMDLCGNNVGGFSIPQPRQPPPNPLAPPFQPAPPFRPTPAPGQPFFPRATFRPPEASIVGPAPLAPAVTTDTDSFGGGPEDVASLNERLSDSFGCLPTDHSPLFTLAGGREKRHTTNSVDQKCQSDRFCYVYAAYPINGCKVQAYGQCCPHSCPVGLPHPTASCAKGSSNPCSRQEGYYCSRTFLTEPVIKYFGKRVDNYFPATCCPSHCPKGSVALTNGHCIPRARFGESCWQDEQCPYSVSCVQGACKCRQHQKQIVPRGSVQPECVLGTSHLRLGERCISHQICQPANSHCSINGTCDCSCGYQKSGNFCVKVQRSCPMDSHVNCYGWSLMGECKKNPNWMMKNCPRACKACLNRDL